MLKYKYDYTEEQLKKLEDHISEVLEDVNADAAGEAFASAMQQGDREQAIHELALHFRKKAPFSNPDYGAGEYDPKIADKAVKGGMREINIDWEFPDGRIQFLFNPTIQYPPVNHEWQWQLGRHGFWRDMARAYQETGDEKYPRAFNQQLLDWVVQTFIPEDWNGPGSGWRTIECGIRLLGSWQVAFNLMRSSESFTDESILIMLGSLHRQAVHLIEHPTRSNWLMMESNGAYAFGALYDEFKDAKTIRDEACRRLTHEMTKQILPDGLQYELSPDYNIVTYRCASSLYKIARSIGMEAELPPEYLQTLEAMALAGIRITTPAFTQPLTNDTHIMQLKEMTGFAQQAFPDRPEFRYVNSNRQEGCPPQGETASCFFPYSGFAVMRSDWGPEASYLNFDVGPLGMAHFHQDKLNINLYKGAEELIFDDGGGQYEISDAREYGLSAYDHNTVLVDGWGQHRTQTKKVEKPIDAGWISTEEMDRAWGIYDEGFGPNEKKLATHKRTVTFLKPEIFLVEDELESADGMPHEYEVLFHLDTVQVRKVPNMEGAYVSDYGRTYEVLILPVSTEDSTGETTKVISGQTDPYRGYFIGRNETANHPATTLSRVSPKALNYRFKTLLIPIRRGEKLPDMAEFLNRTF